MLTYTYNEPDGPNRLREVHDNGAPLVVYDYHPNGAVASIERPAGNTVLRWRHDGYIRKATVDIAANGADLEHTFSYSAAGDRVAKQERDLGLADAPQTKELVVRGAGGERLTTYDFTTAGNVGPQPGQTVPTAWLNQREVELLGSNRLGMWRPSASQERELVVRAFTSSSTTGPQIYEPCWLYLPCPDGAPLSECRVPCPSEPIAERSFAFGMRQYELSNYLGNVLATVTDATTGQDADGDGVAESYSAQVVSARDYYPFGSSIASRTIDGGYQYDSNSKETDEEVGLGWPNYGLGFIIKQWEDSCLWIQWPIKHRGGRRTAMHLMIQLITSIRMACSRRRQMRSSTRKTMILRPDS